MSRQISLLDFVRLFLCFITAFLIYDFVSAWGWSQGGTKASGLGIALLKFVLGIALPAFLAIVLGCIFVSWRLKLIAGTLILYVVIASRMIDLIYSFGGIWLLLGGLLRLSFGLLGALGAIFFWRALKNVRKIKPLQHKPIELGKEKRKPRISVFLLMLSLLSVPATYIAMFVSSFVTIGLSGLVLMLVFQLPRIPIFIIIASFLAPLVAGWATLRALWVMFFPEISFQPATLLNTSNYPSLNSIIDEVCKRIKTKKPTAVILHAEPTFFVMSGKLDTFSGAVKGRILALGMPLLKELDSLEIRSVLAHEFAHFSGRDTLYSTVVSPVYRGITSSMGSLGAAEDGSEGGSVSITMNLLLMTSRLFLGVFLEYFATIDMILSRNRELRADRIAASLYGKKAFSNALKKVTKIGIHFSESSMKTAVESGSNFFGAYSENLGKDKDKLLEYEEAALAEIETEFDSHPSLTTRLESLPETRDTDSAVQSISLENDFVGGLLKKEKELAQEYSDRIKVIQEFYQQYLEETSYSNAEEQNHYDEKRELCPDDSCTGIIESGRCTECGRKV
jgi:Zn-dependent protease with chaperone function